MNLYDPTLAPAQPQEVKQAANAIGWALEQVCHITIHPKAAIAAAQNLHDQGLLKEASQTNETKDV